MTASDSIPVQPPAAMQLDVESLRALIAVIDHGGMTRAAGHLHLTQSAVSWRIKRLEEKVGRPLLVRDGHAVRPNRDGKALIEDGRTMVELHDRVVARLQRAELTGQVRLGANEDIDVERLADILGSFRRIHPGATVQFLLGHTEDLLSMVDAGAIDIAIIQVTDDGLRSTDTRLWTDPLRWATSQRIDHDANPVPLVTYGERCFYQRIGRPILSAAGLDHFTSFAGSSTGAVQAAIEAGLGVGLLTERHLTGGIRSWSPGDELAPLPDIHQIVRTAPGERPAITSGLTEVIARELR